MIARPRLRTVLLLINLVILVLPLAGIWFLRLYESALIRQTETELVAQAAVLAAAFRVDRQQLLAGAANTEYSRANQRADMPRSPALTTASGLDLADDPVLSPPPDPTLAPIPASALAVAAGEALSPVLRDVQPVTLAAIRVTDERGVIVATTGEDFGMSLAGWEEVDRALQGKTVSLMRWRERPARIASTGLSRGANLRVFVALPVIDGERVVGAVVLSRTPRDLVQAIYGKRFHLIALALVLLGLAIVLAVTASRFITRPLGQVVAQAQRVAAGEFGAVVPLTGPTVREATEMSAAVARMAATLEKRAEYIRTFAAHVSHEFKTPLAGAKGALELLNDHMVTMSESERSRFLGVIAASIERLERLVRRLLDLARADMMRLATADATELAPLVERMAERYTARGLAVSISNNAKRAAMPEDALEIVLGCLLDNVLDHAGPGTAVAIETIAVAGGVEITLTDNGPGVTANDARRVFEPFFTTARENGGTGLGLSIARAILTGAGGSIELMPAAAGARFRLTLAA